MTRTDADLERDLRAMLHRRALDVPDVEPDVVPSLPARRGRRPRRRAQALVALAAVVAVALPVAAALTNDGGGDGGTADIGALTQEPVDGGTIRGADGTPYRAAAPMFVADGSPEQVALAYLADRGQFTTHRVDGVDVVADTALVRWSSVDDVGTATPGTIELHRLDGRWGVYAAALSSVVVDAEIREADGVIVASATARDGQEVCLDVLTDEGVPVPHAPDPAGRGGAAPYGTAGCGAGEVAVELAPYGPPVLVRVTVMGRAVDGIAEVRLDPPGWVDTGEDVPGTTTTPIGVSVSTMAEATTTQVASDGADPVIDRSALRVQLFNAAGVQGLAGAQSEELAALGYPVAAPETSDTQLADTRIYAVAGFEWACEAVATDLRAINYEFDLSALTVQTVDPATTPVQVTGVADCFVALGQDLAPGTGVTTTTGAHTTTTSTPAG
jgi:hypothetical protein